MTTMPFAKLRLTSQQFVNPRQTSGLEPELIAELGLHIGLHGLMNPLLVTADGLVIAGQRRYRAIEWLMKWFSPQTSRSQADADEPRFFEMFGEGGMDLSHDEVSAIERRAWEYAECVPVRVVEGHGIDGIALADNVLREQLSSYEIAAHLSRLHDQGATGADLARLVGKSRTYVSRKLSAFRGAGPELRAAWERGELVEEVVQRLAELSHAQQAYDLASGERPKRGPAHRPPIETVKHVLDELELAGHQTNNPRLEVGNARYAAGVVDALRWVAGKQASGDFAKLVSTTEEV